MEFPAPTPQPPYYAVIFSSRRTAHDDEGYGIMAQRMEDQLAAKPLRDVAQTAHDRTTR